MFLASMGLLALFWQTSVSSANTVTVKENEIWLEMVSGERQLTHDSIPKRLPTLSPSGDALVFVVDHPVPPNSPSEEELVVLDLTGNVLRRIRPEGVLQEFDRLDWLDAGRIGAMYCGHANCMYWLINPVSGKTITLMRGGFAYTWSHKRQFVAIWDVSYDCDQPREKGCSEHDSASMYPSDASYPPEWAGKFDDLRRFSHSHDIGKGAEVFVWSPDDKWVAFTDLIGPEDNWYVVILSPDGKMLRDMVPSDPDYKAVLEWIDNSHLDLRTGKRIFHFAINNEEFSEVSPARP